MADYKILQNIDLAQNEIKEVYKISNDRTDGKDKKKLIIQTGNDTSLTFSRKDGETDNSIESVVKEGEIKESKVSINPSTISISSTNKNVYDDNGNPSSEISKLELGLNDSNKEYIEAISPLVDIKTGDTEYTDPHISLNKENNTLNLKSHTIVAESKGKGEGATSSSLTMEDTIVGVSQGITFKDTDSNPNVSLDLNTNGNISLEASKSITETVDKLSVSLDKATTEGKTTQTITIKNSEESNPSQIEVYKEGVKVSKKENSYLDVKETSLTGESSTVKIKTPTKVTFELKETEKTATLSSKGDIWLSSSTQIKDTVSREVENSDGTKTEDTSTLTSTPSGISINSKVNEIQSTLSVGLDANKKEHIEAISPLVDIKTGGADYTDPHISLSQNSLNLKSTEISLNSKGDTNSSLTMNGGITEESDTITFKSNSKYDTTKDYFTVSLNKTADNKGNISLSTKDSITESVGNRSVSIGTSNIVILDSTTLGTESKIEVNDSGIVASKGGNSSITLGSTSLEEKSNTVTIKTPTNVTLELKEDENPTKATATLNSKGKITLTSNKDITNKEASTTYGENSIVSKADSITLQTQGYKDTNTTQFPHIELTSKDNNNSILVEGKTINISSKGGEDTINLSGSKLNVGSTITEITSSTINVGEDGKILDINATTPEVTIPAGTEVDINSTTIGIGDTGSTTTISGSTLEVTTPTTNITSTSTLSGATTLQSSKPTLEKPTPENTLKVDTKSTSITGKQVDINPETVNIGTDTTTDIIIGRNAEGTTTLKSNTTNITSSTLSVTSPTVKFGENINQTISFNGSGSVTSNVNTSVVGKTFSVKNGSNNDILKADTTSVSLAGTSTTITSGSVEIGASDTTTSITIGKNVGNNSTTLQSKETKITSPTVKIGSETTTSLNIGNTSANVTFEGNNNLSITADDNTSNVTAKTLKFEENISSNDIMIYWDNTSKSLVFAKA